MREPGAAFTSVGSFPRHVYCGTRWKADGRTSRGESKDEGHQHVEEGLGVIACSDGF